MPRFMFSASLETAVPFEVEAETEEEARALLYDLVPEQFVDPLHATVSQLDSSTWNFDLEESED